MVQASALLNGKHISDPGLTEDDVFFKGKHDLAFLRNAWRTMGSYAFENQYMNNLIPLDSQSFRKDWFKYYDSLPRPINTFVFIDPAISQADTADFTGVVVVHVDVDNRWYVSLAKRHKLNATQIVELIFKINEQLKPQCIGIEDVAYQRALLHFTADEMRRRGNHIPIHGVRPPPEKSKQTKILGLVPRFEWGNVFLSRGLTDLEGELQSFPRGSHDDLIDALASIEAITYPPQPEKVKIEKPHSPHDPRYEAWVRQQKHRGDAAS